MISSKQNKKKTECTAANPPILDIIHSDIACRSRATIANIAGRKSHAIPKNKEKLVPLPPLLPGKTQSTNTIAQAAGTMVKTRHEPNKDHTSLGPSPIFRRLRKANGPLEREARTEKQNLRT